MVDLRSRVPRRRAAFPRHFARVLRRLRAECPVALPVDVRLAHLMRLAGDCDQDDGRFVIRVGWATKWLMADTLAHEWAHALAWDAPKSHGAEWALAYSRCRRVTMEED